MGAIIYIVIAAVIAGGAWAIKSRIEDAGGAKALAPLAPFTTACGKRKPADCVKEWQDAVAKNVILQADVIKLDQERQACSDGVAAQGRAQVAIETAKANALAKMADATRAAQNEAAAQRAESKKPTPKGVTCEQTLKAVDDSLGELAARRMRNFSVDAVGRPGEKPTADTGAGSDTVRIAP